MTRSSRNGLAFAAACGAAAGVALAYAPPARPADDRNAVDVPAALARSVSHGWPHAPTVTEARQVARYVARTVVPSGASGDVLCRARSARSAGAWACRVRVAFTRDGLTGERFPSPRVYRFRVGVRVWEDGSARVFYPEG